MKKLNLLFYAFLLIVFASCGGNKNSSENVDFNDSTPSKINLCSKGDSARLSKFLSDLKENLKNKNKGVIAKTVQFPIYGAKTEKEFLEKFDYIFTKEFIKSIQDQNLEDIFSNYQGVCIGVASELNLWISQSAKHSEFKIYRINFKEEAPDLNNPNCIFGTWVNVKDKTKILIFEVAHWTSPYPEDYPEEARTDANQGEFRVMDTKIIGYDALNEPTNKCTGKYLLMVPTGLSPEEEMYEEYKLENNTLKLSSGEVYKRQK